MDTELEKHKNVVYQKIGRNVILFQKIELILKYLAATGQVSGYAREIQTIIEQQTATINKQTMGQVVGQFVENTYTQTDDRINEPEELKDIWLSFNFKIQGEDVYKQRKKALQTVIAERNELIHHFVPKWAWNSIDDFREAEQYLVKRTHKAAPPHDAVAPDSAEGRSQVNRVDRQYDKTMPEFENLRTIWEHLQEKKKVLMAFILSDEYKQELQMFELRQSQPILLLGRISRQHARADGWTVLSTAAQRLRQNVPGEVNILKRQYGYKTLKDMMVATGLFDLCEETTKKGGSRLLYRVKSEFSLWATD